MELVERHEKLFHKKSKFNFLERKCISYTVENEKDDIQEIIEDKRYLIRRSSKMIMLLEFNNLNNKELNLIGKAIDEEEKINSLSLRLDGKLIKAINCTISHSQDIYFMTAESMTARIILRCDSIRILDME